MDLASVENVAQNAIALARRWATATTEGQTPSERRTSEQLRALLADRKGLDLAVQFVDRVARPEDLRVAAKELSGLSAAAGDGFLSRTDRALLGGHGVFVIGSTVRSVYLRAVALEQRCKNAWMVRVADGPAKTSLPDWWLARQARSDGNGFHGFWEATVRAELRRDPALAAAIEARLSAETA